MTLYEDTWLKLEISIRHQITWMKSIRLKKNLITLKSIISDKNCNIFLLKLT